MSKYIKVQEDTCALTSKSNVVYKISCNNCDASYVGQTGRQLKTRIAEHRNHIKHKASSRSVITEHRLLHNHDFQWDNVQILDEEPSYRKRLISEMFHIKKQKNSLNLHTDTEGLHKAYLPIINKVWLFDTEGPSPLSIRGVPFQRAVTLRATPTCSTCGPTGGVRFTPSSLKQIYQFSLTYSWGLVSVHFLS